MTIYLKALALLICVISFYRMIDVMVEQLYLSDEFEKYNIRMIEKCSIVRKIA